MATLNQITYNIAKTLDRSDDMEFIERLKFAVGYYRALLLRRTIATDGVVPSSVVQSLGCLALEKVDIAECCSSLGITSGCTVKRTTVNIPKPIRLKGTTEFSYVGPVNFRGGYNPISLVEAQIVSNAKFTAGYPRYWYFKDRIYLINTTADTITITGVFEDPRKLADFQTCTDADAPCYTDDTEYPLPLDLVQNITLAMVGGEFSIPQQHDSSLIRINE